jgi:hypothetical protein
MMAVWGAARLRRDRHAQPDPTAPAIDDWRASRWVRVRLRILAVALLLVPGPIVAGVLVAVHDSNYQRDLLLHGGRSVGVVVRVTFNSSRRGSTIYDYDIEYPTPSGRLISGISASPGVFSKGERVVVYYDRAHPFTFRTRRLPTGDSSSGPGFLLITGGVVPGAFLLWVLSRVLLRRRVLRRARWRPWTLVDAQQGGTRNRPQFHLTLRDADSGADLVLRSGSPCTYDPVWIAHDAHRAVVAEIRMYDLTLARVVHSRAASSAAK